MRTDAVLLDVENTEKLRVALKLYGFSITVQEFMKELENPILPLKTVVGTGYYKDEVTLTQVKRIIENNRGTLKLVFFTNGKYSLLNKYTAPVSTTLITVNYSPVSGVIWKKIQEGQYVLLGNETWDKALKISQLTDCFTKEDAEKFLRTMESCILKRNSHSTYEEMHSYRQLPNPEGYLTLKKLEEYEDLLDSVIKEIKRLEEEEQRKKEQALKERITVTGRTLTLKALDEHTYTIEIPTESLRKEDWITYIYKHRYDWKPSTQQHWKETSFFESIMHDLLMQKHEWFKISVDNKETSKIAIKEIQGRKGTIKLAYLNDKRVAFEELEKALYEYYIRNQALKPLTELPDNEDEAEKLRKLDLRKKREEALMSTGIQGYLEDLEGEIPITIGFEKIGNNWYMVIGEKKLLLRGGIETIHSLEKVLKGTAVGYNARHSTEEFFNRLCRVLSEEEAFEVINNIKEMSRLLKALENKKA